MRRMVVSTLRILLTVVVCLLPFVSRGEEPGSASIPPAATALAMRYLRAVDSSASFPSADGRPEDFIFVGRSRGRSSSWRIIVVGGYLKPRIVWDSFALHDPYLSVTELSFINTEADGRNGY